jgi:hypothetical protein
MAIEARSNGADRDWEADLISLTPTIRNTSKHANVNLYLKSHARLKENRSIVTKGNTDSLTFLVSCDIK